MARVAMSPQWTLGTLRVGPGILPAWIARLAPTYVPVPRGSVRPPGAVAAVASVLTPIGTCPLVAPDGTALLDLDRLERAIVTEQPYTYAPRALPTGVPAAIRVGLARAEHRIRRRLGARPRLAYSVGADAVGALAAYTRGLRTRHPWPAGKEAAFVVSHDVEGDTVQTALTLARAEAALGIRATFFLVPSMWSRTGLADALRQLGHEVACHGIDHSGREVHASPESLRRAAESLGIEAGGGYRSPRFGCGHGHGDRMAGAFDYDSSRPETRRRFREPVWAGAGTIFPYLEALRLVQIPVTLPSDLELLHAGMSWDQVAVAWRSKWRAIREAHGLGTLCTHIPAPGGSQGVLGFLEAVLSDPGTWVGSAGDLVSFLRHEPVHRVGSIRPWCEVQQRRAVPRTTRLPLVVSGPRS